jgi:hypothetical protein
VEAEGKETKKVRPSPFRCCMKSTLIKLEGRGGADVAIIGEQ